MQDVHAQLAQAGLLIDGEPEIGKLTRCRAEGDRGKKESGWYVLHELRLDSGQTVLVGRYGNWKQGTGEVGERIEFQQAAKALSEQERQRLREVAQQASEQAAAERQARSEVAAARAADVWAKLPEQGASPYLQRKQVRAYGLRFSRGSIVVPLRRVVGGDLVGLQFIDADGGKKFLTGTAKRGAFHLVGNPLGTPDEVVAVAEGYATAATVHMATGWVTAVAFDAGNLEPVARALREAFPAARLVLCADDDAATEGNPGVTRARAAAVAVGGYVAVPDFPGVSDVH